MRLFKSTFLKKRLIPKIMSLRSKKIFLPILPSFKKKGKVGVYLYSHNEETGAPAFPAIRQTFFSSGIVGQFAFSETMVDDSEFIITFGGATVPDVAKKFPLDKRICVLMENPKIWLPPPSYLAEMGTVVCPFTIPIPESTRLIVSQAAVPWFYGIKFRTDKGLLHHPSTINNLELQDLAQISMPSKDKLISCIASKKQKINGHKWRIEVAEALKNHFGKNIDLFGFGWNPIAEKREAIDRYHFSVVIENDASDHYWTEKLSDSILGYSVPIYAGARKVEEYFDGGIHKLIHGAGVKETVQQIKKIVEQPPIQEYLYSNRHRVLFEHNFYYMISDIINKS